ncbi:MAG: hypothetical protein J6K55_15220 [Clostridia bacterium]|nr:hypothetical protein [Clostridia bacterium]
MTGQERLHAILNHQSEHCGFWHGCPNHASTETLFRAFDVKDDFELGLKLGSSCRWIQPEAFGMYRHPENKPMFDVLGGKKRISHNQAGVFADCEDPAEVDAFDWPDEKYIDFGPTIAEIERSRAAGQAVLSGSWSCFFHNVCDFFGMENYFVKMYTDPDVVDAVTEHVVDIYLRINERLFRQMADKIDMFFFGNDFGSQLDTLISPEMFDRFVMPAFQKFTDQAHRHGMKVLLHSCGSIYRVIPRLIDAGVDALHPIQAKAANMDAVTLAREFNGKIVFVGGVDTQQLLPSSTPRQVKEEVYRLRDLFGPNFVVSPSHESILPDVPWENVQAMAEAAAE